MKIHGLPETFWVVTQPRRVSELETSASPALSSG